MSEIETGYHDATACAFDGSETWVAWCKIDGEYVDTEKHDNREQARRWCERQKRTRR